MPCLDRLSRKARQSVCSSTGPCASGANIYKDPGYIRTQGRGLRAMSGRGKNQHPPDAPRYSQLEMNTFESHQRREHSIRERRLAKYYHQDLVKAGHADAGALLEAMERYQELVQKLEKVQRKIEKLMRMRPRDDLDKRVFTPNETHKRLDQQGVRLDESMRELGLDAERTVEPREATEAYRRRHYWNRMKLEEAERKKARLVEMADRQPMSYNGRAVPEC